MLIVNELGYEVRHEMVLEAVYRGTAFNGSRNGIIRNSGRDLQTYGPVQNNFSPNSVVVLGTTWSVVSAVHRRRRNDSN